MDIFGKIVVKIIQEQENIIGPIAIEQAKKVPGLTVDWDKHEALLQGDESKIVDALVGQFKNLFGQASVEVCKEAVKDLTHDLPQSQLPNFLS